MPVQNKLSVKQIEHTKCPADKESLTLNDGGGLVVVFYRSGRSVYRLRIKGLNGRESLLTLGKTTSLKLKEARNIRDELHRARSKGEEPRHVLERICGKGKLTVNDLVFEYLKTKKRTWKKSNYDKEYQRAKKYITKSSLGSIPAHALTPMHIYDFAISMDKKGYVSQHIRVIDILRRAYNLGHIKYCLKTPDFSNIKHFLIKHRSTPHACIELSEVLQLSRKVVSSKSSAQVKLLFDFMFLTVLRAKEATQNTWSNVDLEESTLTIPKELSKNGLEHVLPLSPQAIRVLKLAKLISGDSEYIFPSPQKAKDKPISTSPLGNLFRKLGLKGQMTAHGIRSIFSTELHAELELEDSMVIEMILSHTDNNKVRAAYNRTRFINKRKKIMCIWGEKYSEVTEKHSCVESVEKELRAQGIATPNYP
ncbi:tyrosine-type recombinase/integrase [Vibrio campbellii]|uniref:tyrosine-type recombinase/integrase n=1 Tax=Vibrio campbellii TaxID=680 RepID=UPI00039C0348|nr:site-specific integrase [Vibrio campbellii]